MNFFRDSNFFTWKRNRNDSYRQRSGRICTACRNCTAVLTTVAIGLLFSCSTFAQTISGVQPRTAKPGQTISLSIQGKDLNDSVRLIANQPGSLPKTTAEAIQSKLEKVEAAQATIALTLADTVPLGPLNLWLTTSTGALTQHSMLVDDLEPLSDAGNNHSRQSAQPVPNRCTIAGTCDAAASDFYRLQVQAGERIAVEVHTQQLRSVMDPLLRLVNSSGVLIAQADDTSVGPDCRFSHRFVEAGEYFIEVLDSRNAAGGAPYQMRVGDFPIVHQCFPLAVRSSPKADPNAALGTKTNIAFVGPDASQVAREISVPSDYEGPLFVAAKLADGQSSSWLPLWCSRYPQVTEPPADQALTLPVGINGRLSQAKEADNFLLRGTKGQVVRVAAKSRSLGSPALVQMKLLDAAGKQIAATTVSDADEWSFDATIPEDGNYRLEVSDVLNRGGDEFNYWVEVTLAGSFSIALKADAKTPEQFLIEPSQGACAIDLDIARFGYEGEIELRLIDADNRLRLLNPKIPAAAKNARIYLAADSAFDSKSLALVQIEASSVGEPKYLCQLSGFALHRVKEPHVLPGATVRDGVLTLAATNVTQSPFTLEPASPTRFARPVRSHNMPLTLKRLQAEFKAGVELLPNALPTGWEMSTKVDKDSYTLALKRGEQVTDEPAQLPLLVFGEYQGHGRVETINLPIAWFDPVKVSLKCLEPVVQGGRVRCEVLVTRDGIDAQPVTIAIKNLPQGLTAPESLVIAADQQRAEFELQLAADANYAANHEINLVASSKFENQEFTVSINQTLPTLIPSPSKLSIFPTEIVLDDSRGRQQLVITGLSATDSPRDWTRNAKITSANPQIAEVRSGVVYPVADGATELLVEVGAQRQTIPVRVANRQSDRKVDFESEVLVALSKQGCNSGACHGAPSGKGGFRLSLRAFDLQLDKLTLIREDFGRRVNSFEPDQSLLLLKPLMNVAHGGGKQLHKEDEAYKILRDWIAKGATGDPDGTPRVIKLEVFPNQKQILAVDDGGQQLSVTAHFSDGKRRDVTHLVAYETSDTAVATVNTRGFVTPHSRGEVAILVRMLEYIESVPLMFVEAVGDFQWPTPPTNNYVDELVNAKLRQLHYLPAETCSDDEFLRRVSLDLLGILPTPEETTAFLADTSHDKRQRLINSLLDRDEYAKFWALKWGDLLKLTKKLVGDEGVYKYHRWVEQSLRDNMPYDQFARELLSGSGSTLANPPANFYRTAVDMNECVETISQVFLGARLQCAKCHNHPFERWTQDNYYGLGAFFNRVQRRKTDRPGEMFVFASTAGDVTQPRTGQVMSPWLPQVGTVASSDVLDRRLGFVEWLVKPDNPYFARIEANRIWSQLFARGIVDPIDDFRDSNPPSNTGLLDALAKDFVDSGFDRKHLLRVILNSRTYQASFRTSKFNQDDVKYFSHQEPRLLSAEQMLDAINRTLDLKQTFSGLPAGTLATQLPAPDVVKVDFLKVFGQPERSTVCACERSDDSNLGMAIELFNGPLIHEKLRDANNRFRKTLAANKSTEDTIRELYLAAVCRLPSDAEIKTALEHCAKAADPASGVEDVCWALFNTDEFLFQH